VTLHYSFRALASNGLVNLRRERGKKFFECTYLCFSRSFTSIVGSGWKGLPSYRMGLAPKTRAETQELYMIHPVVVY
jgi:hypothetical protein